jgi:class 3 adenylate cyclase
VRLLLEAALEKERMRSEMLLLNILPGPIADRLKAAPGTIADEFNDVTILFADIVGFTRMSATANPVELVGMLDFIWLFMNDGVVGV